MIMAMQKSVRSISRLFTLAGSTASDVVKTPQFYLKLSIEALKHVQAMTSSTKFNSEQCKYLAAKLKAAVDNAQSFLLAQFTSPNRLWIHAALIRPELLFFLQQWLGSELQDMAKCLETFRLLHASAKQVQSFVSSCCTFDAHSVTSMILSNGFRHISSVALDLELCKCAFSPSSRWEASENDDPLTLLLVDRETLVADLKAKILDDDPLATFLLARLDTELQGLIHEVDYRSLQITPEKLGSGGTCIVYKAIWMGAPVAMKTFIGPSHPIFTQEVKNLAGLSHPNILSLLCSSSDDRGCFIVTELMDEDLFSFIQTRMRLDRRYDSGPFSHLESVHMILQIAEGMLYLHQQETAHRDLKTNNILVKRIAGGLIHVKVADFGLSKTKESSSSFSNETPNVGTSRWMAPEMIRLISRPEHSTAINPFKSDVYSFAIVCYEILTGNVPFPTIHSVTEVKERVLLGERPTLPCQSPQKLQDLIERCWHKNANKRPTFDRICNELKVLKLSLVTVEGKQAKYDPWKPWKTMPNFRLLRSQQRPPGSQKVFPKRRVPCRNSVFYCSFTSMDEIQRAVLKAGLEDSSLTLLFGIDFSRGDDGSSSLHAIGSYRNPYEKVMGILGRALSAFDDAKLIPCLGFGDAVTLDKHVFSFNLDDGTPCEGSVKQALASYRAIAPHVHLGNSTSLAPVINAAVDAVQRSCGKHHVLVIISAREVTSTGPDDATTQAIIKASSHPLSIVLIGVGGGPWDTTRTFVATLPDRDFENFHFVNFTELMQRSLPPLQNVADFALAAVMEIPLQYRRILELGLLGKKPPAPANPPQILLPPKVLQTRESPPLIDCPLCLSDEQSMQFNCGHRTCCQCAESLTYCPTCRQAITTRTPLR